MISGQCHFCFSDVSNQSFAFAALSHLHQAHTQTYQDLFHQHVSLDRLNIHFAKLTG